MFATQLVLLQVMTTGALAPRQCEIHEDARLTASEASADDKFGFTVSVSGDVAIVGAHGDDRDGCSTCGAAFVFRLSGGHWTAEAELTASDAIAFDQFGYSVAISGNIAVVGALADDSPLENSGSAYVYRFDGSNWVEEQKLTASDSSGGDEFGVSVSLSGDLIVVGTFGDDCASGNYCGSVYVFRHNGTSWVEDQKLVASDVSNNDFFGTKASVDGNVAIVGSVGSDCATGQDCGSAYIFRYNGVSWVEEQKLTASDADVGDSFGNSVSVSGDVAVVAANRDDCTSALVSCGSVYIFRYNGVSWVEEQKLRSVDPAQEYVFGTGVSVSGNVTVVRTAFTDCEVGATCGSAFVYRFDGNRWVEEAKLTRAETADTNQGEANAISISGDTLVMGDHDQDCAVGLDCGSAYVYALLADCETSRTVLIDIKPGSAVNSIRIDRPGLVRVAILTTLDFDAATVDAETVLFAGAPVAERAHGRGLLAKLQDVDHDGDIDLVMGFRRNALNLAPNATEATLVGQTSDGHHIEGSDSVRIVP